MPFATAHKFTLSRLIRQEAIRPHAPSDSQCFRQDPASSTLRAASPQRGFELVSTGGTARALTDAGLRGHQRVGRHRLSRDDGRPRQDAAPEDSRRHPRAPSASPRISTPPRAHGIGLVDLVCVNLYPFVETAAKPGIAFDDLIEQIDIGGPSLVRAAAKNFRDVLVVVSPSDYRRRARRTRSRRWAERRRSASTSRARPLRTPARTTRRLPRRSTRFGFEDGEFTRAARPRRWRRRGWRSTRTSSAISATARTRISRRRGTPSIPPAGLGAPVDPARQGAVVHEPAGSRRRRAHRARVQRAGGVRDQAHQPVRRRHRRPHRRSLRARARCRQPRRLRRHRRPQPADRRADGARHRLDVHRGGHRAVGAARGAGRFCRPRPTCAS